MQGSGSEPFGMEQVLMIWENPRVHKIGQALDQRAEPKPLWVAFLALLAVRGLQHGSSKSLVELDIFAIFILNELFGINMLATLFSWLLFIG